MVTAPTIPTDPRRPLPVFVFVILALVVATRLPLIGGGYGADADAWLVANTSQHLWESGSYQPSRLPGYPLHEIVSAPLVGLGGSVLSNAGTVAITLVSILVLHRIASSVARFPRLILIAFAFAPVVWQNSAVTLDYLWSLCCLLVSIAAATEKRHLIAGIFLGLAAGFRLTSAAAIVPIFLLVYCADKKFAPVFRLSVAAVFTAAAAYVPLLLTYGPVGWIVATQREMHDVHPDLTMRLLAFGYRLIYFAGPITTAVMTFFLWKSRRDIVRSLRRCDPIVVASVTGIVVFSLLFLLLPLERAYLLPILPFLLLLIDRMFSKRALVITTLCLIGSGLVTVDVIDAEHRRTPSFSLHSGMVIQEWQNRRALLEERERIARLSPAEPAVVITGSGPSFWLENVDVTPASEEEVPIVPSIGLPGIHQKIVRPIDGNKILYIPYLTGKEIDRFRSLSYTIHSITSVTAHVESVTGETLTNKEIIFH